MTTPVTQFDVAFDKLTFTRNSNNLVVSSDDTTLTTYDNFFNGTQMGTITTIETKDDSSGNYTEHTLITEALINVPDTAEYEGYNVEISAGTYEGYNEAVTVKYDGIEHIPQGQTEGYDSVIYGNYGNDVIYGNDEDDWLQGSQGDDVIYGGDGGEDMISGDMGDDKITAGLLNASGKITYNYDDVQLYGAAGNDTIVGGYGDDFIWGGTGDDTLSGKGGANTFIFAEENFGQDIIKDATEKDNLRFSVNNGTATEPSYSGTKFSDLSFFKEGNNLLITAPDYDDNGTTVTNNVTVVNYFKNKSSNRVDKLYALNDNGVQTEYSIFNNANLQVELLNPSERKYKGTNGDETVIATNYVSSNGKTGVSVTLGTGNDIVAGSIYNDTIKTGSGLNNITEDGGTNKITTGNDKDIITVGSYSSNTIKAGKGNNEIYLDSFGTNKVTTGSGNDIIDVSAGNNTVNAGDGNNIITLENTSTNKITTGKGNDTFNISTGLNNVKSGSGVDTFTIAGGYNTINSGSGNSTYTITGGLLNNITGGKNVDTITISGGENYINAKADNDIFNVSAGLNNLIGDKGNDTFNVTGGINTLNGGKGNDVYNFSEYTDLLTTGDITVIDTSGSNNLVLNTNYTNSDVSIYVDVALNSKGKAKINGDWNITSRNNTDSTIEGIALSGGTKSAMGISVQGTTYTVNKAVLNEIASSVASWLSENNFASTTDVFETGTDAEVADLIAVYNTESAKFFSGAM